MEKQVNSFTMNRYKFRFLSLSSSAFLYSALIHVAVLFTLFSIKQTSTFPQKTVAQIILAKLVYKKPTVLVAEQKTRVSEHTKKQSNIKKTDKMTSGSKAKKIIALPDIRKKTKYKNSEVKTKKFTTTTVITRRPSALNTLQSLREKINKQTRSQSTKKYYQAFVENKKFIPRSTTEFNQIPEAKAVEVNVNCDKTINKSIKIVSGLFGGSIKCNNFDGSQKFIYARLEKLGVK